MKNKEKLKEIIEYIKNGIENEDYNCTFESSWIDMNGEYYSISEYYTKALIMLQRILDEEE